MTVRAPGVRQLPSLAAAQAEITALREEITAPHAAPAVPAATQLPLLSPPRPALRVLTGGTQPGRR